MEKFDGVRDGGGRLVGFQEGVCLKGRRRPLPESIRRTVSLEKGLLVFCDGGVVLAERRRAAVIAKDGDGDKRLGSHVGEDVGGSGSRWELWKREPALVGGCHRGIVGELNVDGVNRRERFCCRVEVTIMTGGGGI